MGMVEVWKYGHIVVATLVDIGTNPWFWALSLVVVGVMIHMAHSANGDGDDWDDWG